jgi:hypothetical protein
MRAVGDKQRETIRPDFDRSITINFGSSGKQVPARRERTVSVCGELALWGFLTFLP